MSILLIVYVNTTKKNKVIKIFPHIILKLTHQQVNLIFRAKNEKKKHAKEEEKSII